MSSVLPTMIDVNTNKYKGLVFSFKTVYRASKYNNTKGLACPMLYVSYLHVQGFHKNTEYQMFPYPKSLLPLIITALRIYQLISKTSVFLFIII